MSKPSLADELCEIVARVEVETQSQTAGPEITGLGWFTMQNRDRILAALRFAEIVRETCERYVVKDNGLLNRYASDSDADVISRCILSARILFAEQIFALANEAGERERQG